ncbi:MAG TPA: glycosyl hydrolase 53 family protein [Actinophytocola sp.]|uniref:glycoside hydrolase family 53 protein n=1 Tax=Actinophytocola sp. TaxID=1872138 RepID=UPI002DBAC058|nr:glycosyl hydrolase 53 family protein [Actinophytocola sp.]HEU5470770.1 glycosyl hydrolase 53 family protein [Actinophytocola sp.]
MRRRTLLAAPLVLGLPLVASVPAAAAPGPRVRGVDISFALQEEAIGTVYRDGGAPRPVEQILANRGANLARLRVWIAPPAGYSDLASALTLARRCRAAGMRILLNLHYSDFWADPGKQPTPAAWTGQNLPTLAETVRRYTRDAVAAFARQGTPVAMIQVGNEITSGMLFPLGQIYRPDGEHWPEFTTLLKAGITGAREGNPSGNRLEIMVHIDRGGDNGGARYFYDHVLAEGVRFDTIGLSYYPFWHGSLATLRANLADLSNRYRKDLVIVETSYPWTLNNGDTLGNFITSPSQLPDGAAFPATRSGQAAYFEELRNILAAVPGGRGAGFVDWSPEWLPGVGWTPGEGNPNDNLTMFDWSGNALPCLRSFRAGS